MKPAALLEAKPTIRFKAELEPNNTIQAPQELRGAKIVEGTIEDFPFRAPIKEGRITVSATLQAAARTKPGVTATVEITRIDDEPEVRIPVDFQNAIEKATKAKDLFEEVTPNARREWVRWIASAKKEETREKRIEVGIDKLTKGMRRPCCFPGLNFVTKGVVEPEETWAPLPNSKD